MVKYITIILFVLSLFSVAFAETNDVELLPSNENNFEMNLISRGRVELMRSFHKRDSAEVLSNIARLDSMNYGRINSISRIEKEIILLEMEMWRDLLHYELACFKSLYDFLAIKEQSKMGGDELSIFVNKIVSKLGGILYNRYSERIVNSELSDSEKDELEILLLLHDAPNDFEAKNLVAKRSRTFAARYPLHPDAEWIEKCVGFPYSHMYVEEMYMQDKSNRKERTIESKLYTGGFGTNVFLYSGGWDFGLDNLYDKELFESDYEPPNVNIELYLQWKKFSLNAEIRNTVSKNVFVYSFGFGFVFYDSRFLKIRPYLAFGFPCIIYVAKQDLKDERGNSLLTAKENESCGRSWTAAVNFDYKFLTVRFFNSEHALFSMSLVSKIGFSSISFDRKFIKGSGVDMFFDIGLGMYLW
jgi:hypothetical protein